MRHTVRALCQYASLTHKELAKLAREKGIKGVPEGWERETIINKLKAL